MDSTTQMNGLTSETRMNIHSEPTQPMFNPATAPHASADVSNHVSRGKREDILDAALALFVDRGFHGTAVPALATRANVGAGTIYRYFHNKDSLVNVLYRQCKSAIAEHVAGSLDTAAAPRDVFATFWNRTIEFARQNPLSFAFLELHHHASYLDAESVALEKRVVLLAREIIESMKTTRALRDLPAELLMSVIDGALVGFVRGAWEGRYELDQLRSQQAQDCTWAAIASTH